MKIEMNPYWRSAVVILWTTSAFATPKILDESVIGLWNFNGDTAEEVRMDSSGHGGSFTSGGEFVSPDGYKDGGGGVRLGLGDVAYLQLGKDAAGNQLKLGSFYSLAVRAKTSDQMSDLPDKEVTWGLNKIDKQTALFGQKINDHSAWHSIGMRVQTAGGVDLNTNSKYDFAYFCDLDTLADNRAEVAVDSASGLPLSVDSSGKVALGGNIYSSSYPFGGVVTEVMVINRMLSKQEFIYLYFFGETYIRSMTDGPEFSGATGWSSTDGASNYAPGGWPGAAYIVDNNFTITKGGTATFGGDVGKRVSLTVGRKARLTSQILAQGFFDQNAAGTLTFYDLRLVNGKWTAGGTGLRTTLLDIDSPDGESFEMYVPSGEYTIDIVGDQEVTGKGVLKKTGDGMLVLNNFNATEGAKIRLSAGSIKTKVLNGYESGTLIVDAESIENGVPTVEFFDDDVTKRLEKLNVLFVSKTPFAYGMSYPVMRVPLDYTENDVAVKGNYQGQLMGVTRVENGVVYLDVGVAPSADKGAKPMIIWE